MTKEWIELRCWHVHFMMFYFSILVSYIINLLCWFVNYIISISLDWMRNFFLPALADWLLLLFLQLFYSGISILKCCSSALLLFSLCRFRCCICLISFHLSAQSIHWFVHSHIYCIWMFICFCCSLKEKIIFFSSSREEQEIISNRFFLMKFFYIWLKFIYIRRKVVNKKLNSWNSLLN